MNIWNETESSSNIHRSYRECRLVCSSVGNLRIRSELLINVKGFHRLGSTPRSPVPASLHLLSLQLKIAEAQFKSTRAPSLCTLPCSFNPGDAMRTQWTSVCSSVLCYLCWSILLVSERSICCPALAHRVSIRPRRHPIKLFYSECVL